MKTNDYFDLFDTKRGAQSLLKALRLHKAGDVAGGETEISWMYDKLMSQDVFLLELFNLIGDKELSKLIPALHAITGKKFHSRLMNRLLVNRKYISAQAMLEHIEYAGIKGQVMVHVIEEVGIKGYFEILNGLKDHGVPILQLNSVLSAGLLVRLEEEELREFIAENLRQGFSFGAKSDVPVVDQDISPPALTMEELQSSDWRERLFQPAPAKARRELMQLIWKYLESGGETLRGEIYRYFAELSKDRYENCIQLITPLMGKNLDSKELLLDLMDIYLETHKRISFSEGFAFCIAAAEILDPTDLDDYIDDLVEVVEEQREERENILAAVNRFTVPSIFNKYTFKTSAEAIFAFKVFERLSYTSLPPTFFMRYLQVFKPELVDQEVQRLIDEIERDFIGLSRVSVLKNIAESKPAAAWLEKANEFRDKGLALTSREWSTGVDTAVRTKNRELFEYAMTGYQSAPDAEPEYFLFHSSRFLLTWGEVTEWPKVLATFEEMRKSQGRSDEKYLEPWMLVWMVRNAAERWLVTVEDFIEKYMYKPGAIDSKVLSALCERYRMSKQTEEIRRVINRFGSRVKGEADWSLLVLARAYYEVNLPDMALEQLETIASGPVVQEVKRRAHSYGMRFDDPRVFDLFQLED
jgi:hypothetical protein